jgi:serine/threonine protein phosphatase PrpC
MIQCGRVMNRLAITRALGDFEFKILHVPGGEIQRKEYITCQPEIRMMEIDPFTDDFIIMGSDGCFDKFTSQEVITFIRNKVATSDYSELPKIARELANEVIYGKSVRDNITVIIIALNRGLVVVNNIA